MVRCAFVVVATTLIVGPAWSQGAAEGSGPIWAEGVSWPTLYRDDLLEVTSFGYLRSLGFGGRVDGGPQTCAQLPDAPVKYRLGNECETYLEPGLSVVYGPRDGGPTLSFDYRASTIGTEPNAYDDWTTFTIESWGALDDFAAQGPLEGARIWAGQRFYYRQDTHIHDFYYWNGTGLGAGIEQIPFGRGELAVAVFEHSSYDLATALDPGTPYRRVEVRVAEWQQSERVLLRGAADLRVAKDDFDTVADFGGLVALEAEVSEVWQGSLSLTGQIGWGAGHGLDFGSDPEADQKEVGARLVASYLTNRGDDFSMQATTVLEAQSRGREWISVGARPIWRLGGAFHAALEPGLDITFADGERQVLGKVTGALEWKPGGPDFYDRPAFRAFVTRADWNTEARRAGLSPGDDGDTAQTTFGVQLEHWW